MLSLLVALLLDVQEVSRLETVARAPPVKAVHAVLVHLGPLALLGMSPLVAHPVTGHAVDRLGDVVSVRRLAPASLWFRPVSVLRRCDGESSLPVACVPPLPLHAWHTLRPLLGAMFLPPVQGSVLAFAQRVPFAAVFLLLLRCRAVERPFVALLSARLSLRVAHPPLLHRPLQKSVRLQTPLVAVLGVPLFEPLRLRLWWLALFLVLLRYGGSALEADGAVPKCTTFVPKRRKFIRRKCCMWATSCSRFRVIHSVRWGHLMGAGVGFLYLTRQINYLVHQICADNGCLFRQTCHRVVLLLYAVVVAFVDPEVVGALGAAGRPAKRLPTCFGGVDGLVKDAKVVAPRTVRREA